jgi:hypothetical protein
MQSIAMLLASARAHFRAKTPSSPAKPPYPSARCSTSHIHTALAKTNLKDELMLPFAKSPLADADDLSPTTIDAVLAVFSDASVQRHAAEVRGKLMRLIEFSAMRSEVAAAVAAIGTHSTELTPAAVVAVLRQRAADLDDALDDARTDRVAHETASKARVHVLAPLRHAVSTRLGALTREREHCLVCIDAARRASTMSGSASHRYNGLVAAGLKPDEITAALGIQSPADDEAAVRARIVAIDAEIVPLHAFGESGDVEHLSGLGLDDLIAQAYPERAAEVAA